MKATPEEQNTLLTLKDLDTQLYQLEYQRKHLPAIAEVEQMQKDASDIEAELGEVDAEYKELRDRARFLERDADEISTHLQRDRSLLGSGSVGSPKQLENLEHEVSTLKERLTALEDVQLEVMEELEVIETKLLSQRARLDQIHGAVEEAAAKRDAQLQRLAEESDTLKQQRGELASTISAPLLAVYERSGAGELHARRCGSCRMELPATEYAAIEKAAPDTVLRCESCGAVLVRTERSGL